MIVRPMSDRRLCRILLVKAKSNAFWTCDLFLQHLKWSLWRYKRCFDMGGGDLLVVHIMKMRTTGLDPLCGPLSQLVSKKSFDLLMWLNHQVAPELAHGAGLGTCFFACLAMFEKKTAKAKPYNAILTSFSKNDS